MKQKRICAVLIGVLLVAAVPVLLGYRQSGTLTTDVLPTEMPPTTGILPTEIPPTTAPSSVDISLYCVEIDENYAVIDKGRFTLKGFYEDVESDSSHFHLDALQIMELAANINYSYSLIVQLIVLNNPAPSGYNHYNDFTGFIWLDQQRTVRMEMDASQEWVFIRVDDRMFVAAADEASLTPDTMLQKYSKMTGNTQYP